MQLEASDVPIESSPAAGLHEDPTAIPHLERLPEPLHVATEVQQGIEAGETEGEGRVAEVQRQQVRAMDGPGKGKGVKAETRCEAGFGVRNPPRTPETRQEMSNRPDPAAIARCSQRIS